MPSQDILCQIYRIPTYMESYTPTRLDLRSSLINLKILYFTWLNTSFHFLPFSCLPPRTNGQGSRVLPGQGRRCAWASPSWLALRARGLCCALASRATRLQLICTDLRKKNTPCMNLYHTIRIKIVWICTKTVVFVQIHTIQFVCNLYSTNCVVQICIIQFIW